MMLSPSHAYRFRMFKHLTVDRVPTNHRNRLVGFKEMLTLYADPHGVLMKNDKGVWIARRF